MLIALATLLVCGFMFAIYWIVRLEERRLEGYARREAAPPRMSLWRHWHFPLRGWF